MTPDSDLLRRYAEGGDETAFGEVVRRHADFVYSIALRVTNHSQLAQDATQTVFTKLARHAAVLAQYDTLAGWLHTTTRHTAIKAIRGECRRRAREQEACTMQTLSALPDVNWEKLRPLLDEAVSSLRDQDRKAVLLRFFQNLSHREVGVVLGISEDTARKRVERALEKLRAHFGRRGVTTTSTALAAAISANSVQAAPGGLAAKITPQALAGASTTAGGFFLRIVLMNAPKKTLVAAALLLLLGVAIMVPHWRTNPVPSVASASRAEPSSRNIIEAPKLPAAQPGDSPAVPAPAPVRVPSASSAIPVAGASIKPVSMDATNEHTEVDLGQIVLSPNVPVQIVMPSGETGTMVGNIGDDGLVHVYVDIPVPVPGGGSIMLHDESIGPKDKGMGRAMFGKENINISYSTALQDN